MPSSALTRLRHARCTSVRLAAGAVLALLAGVVTIQPASAHDEILKTTPGRAEVVVAPSEVVLVLTEAASAVGTQLAVADRTGASVIEGKVRLVGTTVHQALKSGLTDGNYTVIYRLASRDGHVMTGTYDFTVSAEASPTPTLGPGVTAAPAPGGAMDPGMSMAPGTSMSPGVSMAPGASSRPGVTMDPNMSMAPGQTMGTDASGRPTAGPAVAAVSDQIPDGGDGGVKIGAAIVTALAAAVVIAAAVISRRRRRGLG